MGAYNVAAGNKSGMNVASHIHCAGSVMKIEDSDQIGAPEGHKRRISFLSSGQDPDHAGHSRAMLERSQSGDDASNRTHSLRSPSSTDNARRRSLVPKSAPTTPLSRRRGSLQLPSFKSLGISSIDLRTPLLNQTRNASPSRGTSTDCGSPLVALAGVSAPLTPPPEDMTASRPDKNVYQTQVATNMFSNPSSEDTSQTTSQVRVSTHSALQGVAGQQSVELINSATTPHTTWLSRAVRKTAVLLQPRSLYEIQMVSQTLPSQAKDGRSRPTFEEILQLLQTELNPSPYITITHAVPEARIMEEIPKTPPSTPNPRHEINDYFGSNQTVFTHAAVVPIYHSFLPSNAGPSVQGRYTHHIAAPLSINVSILERYIPPTMSNEIEDFFDISPRSYLADRLSELSCDDGSLLLVYPTRNGGQTFARKYVAPVIDPVLRRFVMLNGLTSHVASTMGHMTAVDHMFDFEQMRDRLDSLCHTLTARPAVRGQLSAYQVMYAERSNVILDRSIWLNWYMEQEQSRLRRNLVEYHQAGGRMPQAEGHREVTVGMLVRDFLDEVKKSKEAAGDTEIEMGVFVITRSRL